MPKFREKPTEIEAEQFDLAVTPWPKGVTRRDTTGDAVMGISGDYLLDGMLLLDPGNWIVTDRLGARTVVDAATFEATYEPIDE